MKEGDRRISTKRIVAPMLVPTSGHSTKATKYLSSSAGSNQPRDAVDEKNEKLTRRKTLSQLD